MYSFEQYQPTFLLKIKVKQQSWSVPGQRGRQLAGLAHKQNIWRRRQQYSVRVQRLVEAFRRPCSIIDDRSNRDLKTVKLPEGESMPFSFFFLYVLSLLHFVFFFFNLNRSTVHCELGTSKRKVGAKEVPTFNPEYLIFLLAFLSALRHYIFLCPDI